MISPMMLNGYVMDRDTKLLNLMRFSNKMAIKSENGREFREVSLPLDVFKVRGYR